jgi:hypothetical protein
MLQYLICMSQQLTLELSDKVYADLQQRANSVGLSITEWIVATLTHQNNSIREGLHPAEQQEQARQRFRSRAGIIRLGYPTGADNEPIDADLARAYADEH